MSKKLAYDIEFLKKKKRELLQKKKRRDFNGNSNRNGNYYKPNSMKKNEYRGQHVKKNNGKNNNMNNFNKKKVNFNNLKIIKIIEEINPGLDNLELFDNLSWSEFI